MSDQNRPLVSIVTVNYNQSQVTAELLASLARITYGPVEIIVVDNGSAADPMDFSRHPGVVAVTSEKNLGYAGGCNLGARAAKGEMLLFLNNDTEVDPGFLEPLVARLQSDPAIGMVSPKIRFFHSPDIIQYAGYTPMSRLTLRQHLIGYRQKDCGQYDVARSTFSVHGAAMMVPRRVIAHAGLLAEDYFLYYEEHDWAERIKKAGYSIYYEPASLVLHKESVSTGRASPLKIYYLNRNRLLFARRHLGGLRRAAALIYLFAVALPKSAGSFLVTGRFDLAWSAIRAYAWNPGKRVFPGNRRP